MNSINSKEQLDAVMTSTTPAVIDFWASWCAPCRAMEPHFEAISQSYPEDTVKFYKLSTEEHPELARIFNVRSIPTTIFVLNGTVVDHAIGAMDANKLGKRVELLLSKARGESFFDRLLGRRKADEAADA